MEYGKVDKLGSVAETDIDTLCFDGSEWKAQGGTERYKVIYHQRDAADTTPAVLAFTGVGFRPSALFCFSGLNSSTVDGKGFVDSFVRGIGVAQQAAGSWSKSHGNDPNFAQGYTSSGNGWVGVLTSYDSDGFTITYTRSGTPSGSITFCHIALR